MGISKILNNTYSIDTGKQFIPFYRLEGNNIILIDCGLPEDRELIEDVLSKEMLVVNAILATHAHIDHIGNASFFQEKYEARIIMPQLEASRSNSTSGLKSNYMYLPESDIYKYYKDMIVDPDDYFPLDGCAFKIFDRQFQIIPTQGHTPGHVSIITPDNVVCLGDVLLSDSVIDKVNIPYSHSIRKDIETKKSLIAISAVKFIIPHMGVYENIDDLILRNINKYLEVSETILSLITERMGFEDILANVIGHFDSKVGDIKRFNMMERMTRPYIDYLIDVGRLRREIAGNKLLYVVS